MEPIKANFLLIKVEENLWDVAIFADKSVLSAFNSIYQGHYIEESVFDKKPMIVIPDFPNQIHAETWKQYWIEAFADPDNSCKTCTTVNDLMNLIEQGRKEEQAKK